MNETEIGLIKEAQRGNVPAFEKLIKTHDKQVLQLAYNMLHNTEDAEDAYQEIFVRVFENLAKFKFKSEFSTWLYRVTVNTCINYQKARKRRQHFSMDDSEPGREERWQRTFPGSEPDPERLAINEELSRKIDAAVDNLSEQQRTVFILRHYHGKKLKDIARIMNCTEGTIKNYLFRATQKMQTFLNEYSDQG